LFGDHPTQKVSVQLKDKAATLAGRVFDADTGRPLKAGVGFTNLRTEGVHSVAANGKFHALIPANTDVYVIVEEVDRDHADWGIFKTKVNLQPGQEKYIDMPLFKTATPSDTSE
jgi:hypothetical protein